MSTQKKKQPASKAKQPVAKQHMVNAKPPGKRKRGQTSESDEDRRARLRRMGFQKGQSGNPGGRKPGHKTLSEAMRAFLEQPIDKKATMTMAEAIVTTMLKMAKKGSVNAAVFVRDTAEGKPAQKVLVEGDTNQRERERERQVKFLTRTIKTVAADGASVEEIWSYVVAKERDLFGEDISQLKPMVMAALGEGDNG